MRFARESRRGAVALAVLNLLLHPMLVHAATPVTSAQATVGQQQATITDVRLAAGGVFSGQLLDSQGNALESAPVCVNGRDTSYQATTDAQGRFSVPGVVGGLYRIDAAGQRKFCRFWTAQAAPPAAKDGLLLVAPGDFVLGQHCGCGTPVTGGYGRKSHPFRNPVVMGGVVAAAIAIPVAVRNSDDDEPLGSP